MLRHCRDEANIPSLDIRTDERLFERTTPNDFPPETNEDWQAPAPVFGICFSTCRKAAIRVVRAFPKADQVQHVYRTRPVISAKLFEIFFREAGMDHDSIVPIVSLRSLPTLILRRSTFDPGIQRLTDVMGRHHPSELLALDRESLSDGGIEPTRHSAMIRDAVAEECLKMRPAKSKRGGQ
jgi:hypothetical protein